VGASEAARGSLDDRVVVSESSYLALRPQGGKQDTRAGPTRKGERYSATRQSGIYVENRQTGRPSVERRPCAHRVVTGYTGVDLHNWVTSIDLGARPASFGVDAAGVRNREKSTHRADSCVDRSVVPPLGFTSTARIVAAFWTPLPSRWGRVRLTCGGRADYERPQNDRDTPNSSLDAVRRANPIMKRCGRSHIHTLEVRGSDSSLGEVWLVSVRSSRPSSGVPFSHGGVGVPFDGTTLQASLVVERSPIVRCVLSLEGSHPSTEGRPGRGRGLFPVAGATGTGSRPPHGLRRRQPERRSWSSERCSYRSVPRGHANRLANRSRHDSGKSASSREQIQHRSIPSGDVNETPGPSFTRGSPLQGS
jgi:hypothetical protein